MMDRLFFLMMGICLLLNKGYSDQSSKLRKTKYYEKRNATIFKRYRR